MNGGSATARSDGPASTSAALFRGEFMGGIQQCVKDVLRIAYETEDFSQAKARIEQLFIEAKAGHRGHRAVAQRIRDQIDRAYNDVPLASLPCLDRVLEWLDRDHLRQRRQAD
jgi:hypothetical protein